MHAQSGPPCKGDQALHLISPKLYSVWDKQQLSGIIMKRKKKVEDLRLNHQPARLLKVLTQLQSHKSQSCRRVYIALLPRQLYLKIGPTGQLT